MQLLRKVRKLTGKKDDFYDAAHNLRPVNSAQYRLNKKPQFK